MTAQATRIAVINGPNLNLLGGRDPSQYGTETLGEIEKGITAKAQKLGLEVSFFQSNVEGEIVNSIQHAMKDCAGIIINGGAYSHTSIAIRDALENFKGPVIEVHLSNIYKREEFRHVSHISQVAKGVIAGFGGDSYLLAVEQILKLIRK